MDTVSHQEEILDEVRRFVNEELRPRAAEFDEREALPKDVICRMAERRLLLASLPQEHGGLGLDPLYYGLVTEEMGKVSSATCGLINVQSSLIGESLLKWGSEDLKAKWLPAMASGEKIGAFALTEPHVGSDAKSVQTSYEPHADGFLLRGQKRWISFAGIADFFLVIASRNGEVTAFIVERGQSGLTISPMKGLLAHRASHIAELNLDGVFVPMENILGPVGGGFPYVVGTALDHGRYGVAWSGVAVAQAALDAMVTYARHRRQFDKRICEFQLIQGIIADAVTRTHAARALCIRAGELRKRGDADAITETAIAKYFASKVAVQVAGDAVQVHGGDGFSPAFSVGRLFREAKALEIIEGTSQIQQQLIARYGLRRYCQR